jgi:hypothetical protein
MTQSVVSRLENPDYGKVTVQTLLQVAIALDIALLVRFCSYPDFLAAIADVSPEAFAVENIYETIERPFALTKLMTSLSHTSMFDHVLLGRLQELAAEGKGMEADEVRFQHEMLPREGGR